MVTACGSRAERRLQISPQSSSERPERAWRYEPSVAGGGDERVYRQIDLRLCPSDVSLLQSRGEFSADGFPRGPRSDLDVLEYLAIIDPLRFPSGAPFLERQPISWRSSACTALTPGGFRDADLWR